jgi:hypothetical protein
VGRGVVPADPAPAQLDLSTTSSGGAARILWWWWWPRQWAVVVVASAAAVGVSAAGRPMSPGLRFFCFMNLSSRRARWAYRHVHREGSHMLSAKTPLPVQLRREAFTESFLLVKPSARGIHPSPRGTLLWANPVVIKNFRNMVGSSS